MTMLALKPPMGWNPWNTFCWNINDSLIRETADYMANNGFLQAGYNTIVLDDCWMSKERDKAGNLVPDPQKFPYGIKLLADYVHAKGFKFGIYVDAGTNTCAGFPGSYGYEKQDAKMFANWGVDFVKYDGCYLPPGANAENLYRRMGQALRETGRDIIFSASLGIDGVWTWMKRCGAHMWRITGDILDSWESIEEVGFGAVGLEAYSGPGGWNDLDMMVVGLFGEGWVGKLGKGCTLTEYQSHFALWCMLSAPLMLGNNIRKSTPEIKNILLNKDLIAINQDDAGIPASHIPGSNYVLARPLSDGRIAFGLFNKGDNTKLISLAWDYCGWDVTDKILLYDAIEHKELGEFTGCASFRVESHGCKVVIGQRITK